MTSRGVAAKPIGAFLPGAPMAKGHTTPKKEKKKPKQDKKATPKK